MRTDGIYGGAPAYSSQQPGRVGGPARCDGAAAGPCGRLYAYDPQDDPPDDCFRAGGDLWRVMTEEKRALLIENTARNIAPVTENVKYRHAVHCCWADPEYGRRMTEALGLDMERVSELAKGDHRALVQATL